MQPVWTTLLPKMNIVHVCKLTLRVFVLDLTNQCKQILISNISCIFENHFLSFDKGFTFHTSFYTCFSTLSQSWFQWITKEKKIKHIHAVQILVKQVYRDCLGVCMRGRGAMGLKGVLEGKTYFQISILTWNKKHVLFIIYVIFIHIQL